MSARVAVEGGARHHPFLPAPREYSPVDYNGLKAYYRVRNRGIGGLRNTAAMTKDYSHGLKCPDTSHWKTASDDDNDYIHAQHVALSVRYRPNRARQTSFNYKLI